MARRVNEDAHDESYFGLQGMRSHISMRHDILRVDFDALFVDTTSGEGSAQGPGLSRGCVMPRRHVASAWGAVRSLCCDGGDKSESL
jgi:hypothetical protein